MPRAPAPRDSAGPGRCGVDSFCCIARRRLAPTMTSHAKDLGQSDAGQTQRATSRAHRALLSRSSSASSSQSCRRPSVSNFFGVFIDVVLIVLVVWIVLMAFKGRRDLLPLPRPRRMPVPACWPVLQAPPLIHPCGPHPPSPLHPSFVCARVSVAHLWQSNAEGREPAAGRLGIAVVEPQLRAHPLPPPPPPKMVTPRVRCANTKGGLASYYQQYM